MKTSRLVLLLLALAAARLAMMAAAPVFEPSEARYAAISANMARSGDFVVPRFTHEMQYQSFDGKPPLVFQAGGLFCKAFGVREFSVRLFPFLSAALLLWILWGCVRRSPDGGEDAARLAVAVCATCTAFYAAAGVSMTDVPLACCTAGALLLYRRFLDGFAMRHALGVAFLLGAGMIVKGPVAIAMFGAAALLDAAVNRRWRGIFNWKWLAAAPLFLAVAAPWFVLSEIRNPGSVVYFFYNENFLRFVSHDYGDRYGAGREAFRGVSVVWALVATLPWALLVRPKKQDFKRFEFLAAAAITGFWCLTSRVLVYYLFPVVPLFAAWLATTGRRERLWKAAVPFAALSAVLVASALAAGAAFSDKMRGPATPFNPFANNYAWEFYHGVKPESELAEIRARREEAAKRYREAMEKQKAAEGAK